VMVRKDIQNLFSNSPQADLHSWLSTGLNLTAYVSVGSTADPKVPRNEGNTGSAVGALCLDKWLACLWKQTNSGSPALWAEAVTEPSLSTLSLVIANSSRGVHESPTVRICWFGW
jgi:hypothetical protein